MAITVTKPGKRPEDETYRGECGRCGCKFECTMQDGKWLAGDPDDYRDHGHLEVRCPTCGTGTSCYPAQWIGQPSPFRIPCP